MSFFCLVYEVEHGIQAIMRELSVDLLDLSHQTLKEIQNLGV